MWVAEQMHVRCYAQQLRFILRMTVSYIGVEEYFPVGFRNMNNLLSLGLSSEHYMYTCRHCVTIGYKVMAGWLARDAYRIASMQIIFAF